MDDIQYKQIEQYFNREMSDSQLEDFRNNLKNDAELREAFQFSRLMAAAKHQSEVAAFKKQYKINGASKPLPQAATTRRLPVYKIAVAASIALLLGFFAWWQFSNSPSHAAQLAIQYDVVELHPDIRYALVNEGLNHKGMMGSSDFQALKKEGLEAYQAKNWDKAIQLLTEFINQIEVSDENTPDEINLINLYIGRAYLEKEQFSKAIAYLKKAEEGVIDLPNYGLLKELMQWQLALAYLKNDEPLMAKEIATALSNAQHDTIQKQAKNLLNDLK